MQHSFKYWITSRGIFFLFLILFPSFYVSAQKQIEYLYKVVTKPSFVTPPLKLPKIPRYVPRACFPQLVPTNSSIFLGTLERQVTKFDHKSVHLLSLPKESIPASIHDKPTTDPPFHNLLPIRSHSKPTFAHQEEMNNQQSFDATFTPILQDKDGEAKSKTIRLLSPEDDKKWIEFGREIDELGIRLGLKKIKLQKNLLFNKGIKFDFKKKNDLVGFNNCNYGYEYKLDAA